MFNRDEKNQKDSETIVGASVTMRGDFEGKGNIIIEGTFEGNLISEGSLYAGEKSTITANIHAKEAKILGKVTGEIILEGLLELGPQARIEGNMTIGNISIARGATINGQIKMNKDKSTRAEKQESIKE